MSRSRRKSPVVGNTLAESEKVDKTIAHRANRRTVKQFLDEHLDDAELPDEKETGFGDPWSWSKDGKHRLRNPTDEDLRK